MIYRETIISKNIHTLQYNSDTKILRVLYRSGYLYLFYGVTKRVYDAIAEGGGKVGWRLLPSYNYRQINRGYSIDLSGYGFNIEELMMIQRIFML